METLSRIFKVSYIEVLKYNIDDKNKHIVIDNKNKHIVTIKMHIVTERGYMSVFLRRYFGYLVGIDVNALFYKEKMHSQVSKMNQIYKTILGENRSYETLK
jgi:hypothetical protein